MRKRFPCFCNVSDSSACRDSTLSSCSMRLAAHSIPFSAIPPTIPAPAASATFPTRAPARSNRAPSFGSCFFALSPRLGPKPAYNSLKKARARASSPLNHQQAKLIITISLASTALDKWCLQRLTALLFPEPHGPLRPITAPWGDFILRKLVARARAKGSTPNRSSQGASIGWSL
ncbi:hypothetical protein D3C85_857430 [compost metagenome]